MGARPYTPSPSTLAGTRLPDFAVDARRACATADPRLFFPEHGDVGRAANGRAAIEVCNLCPFVNECREYAVPITDLYGVWGATTPADRQQIRIRRAQAAERKGRGAR
jgi:WhiB family redox-sensing transcriptional regulator